ncbi:hypothetical protein BACCIP111899_00174 [Bacillus rhizoplanae]|uniref:Uncharacterized protein n=1 Tax=Bacillus rhizoplanae TaxID=2880966 RepID=A0ABN7ZST2_9BACI|nr:hypothetical protein BACCIP111899_00174 [Bacillus rhizoplanae]
MLRGISNSTMKKKEVLNIPHKQVPCKGPLSICHKFVTKIPSLKTDIDVNVGHHPL